jgi:hypothetical protein
MAGALYGNAPGTYRAALEVTGLPGLSTQVMMNGLLLGEKITPGTNKALSFTGNTSTIGNHDSQLKVQASDDQLVPGAQPVPDSFFDVYYTVIDHAHASCSPTSEITTGTIDFGADLQGAITMDNVSLCNFGYSSLQALLEVYNHSFAGSPAFGLTGAFSPMQVGGTPQALGVQFDRTGLAPGSYSATLTFNTHDDYAYNGLGGGPTADLVFSLTGQVMSAGIPEPATLLLLGLGAAGLMRRRRN